MKKLIINSISFSQFLFSFIVLLCASKVHAQLGEYNRSLILQDESKKSPVSFVNTFGNLDIFTQGNTDITLLTNSVYIGAKGGGYKLNVDGSILAGQALISQKIDGYAAFGHKDMVKPANDYSSVALMQRNTGATIVNGATGTFVSLRINNMPQLTVKEANTTVENILNVLGDGNATTPHIIKGNTVLGGVNSVKGATLTVRGRIHVSDEDASQRDFKNFNSEYYKDYLLWVQEGIVTNDVAIAHTDHWPDYVFEKDYKLNSLTELENFIKMNGHLPTMPAAKEVEEKGYTVSDITKRSIQTIEELTLHIINQQKQIEKQTKLIESLEIRLNSLERK